MERYRFTRSTLPAVAAALLFAAALAAPDRVLELRASTDNNNNTSHGVTSEYLSSFLDFLIRPDESSYHHVWPQMQFGWEIVLGSLVGFLGAAFGSVGGVGGGGIFVPMLSLIIGFDPKSSTAISKCMIMGAAGSTVYFNLKLRHPTLGMPIIDYDLALLIQPMLMLGISIGVAFNVIFPDWMVTVLLIILFLGTSTKAFMKGVETWKKETLLKKEAVKRLESSGGGEQVEYRLLPNGPDIGTLGAVKSVDTEFLTMYPGRNLAFLFLYGWHSLQLNSISFLSKLVNHCGLLIKYTTFPVFDNVSWTELGLLVLVWMAFLALQIAKNYTATCSIWYWVLNLLQIPVAVGVTAYEAINLYRGDKVIASKGYEETQWEVHQLFLYCLCGVIAGIVGGLLGLGGGFILGPLFLELGIPPQVSSATATFAMTFSSSMSVVEYYLLNRFPVPYALYFVAVAAVAAFVGQHVVRRIIIVMGRASLIIFILASTIFISAISLGGVGISNMIAKINRHEYMGFENLCKYHV